MIEGAQRHFYSNICEVVQAWCKYEPLVLFVHINTITNTMNVQSIPLVKVIITEHDHRSLGIECLHEPVEGVGFKIFDIETQPLDQHLAKSDVIVSINGTDVGNCSFEEFVNLFLAAMQTDQIELIVQKG